MAALKHNKVKSNLIKKGFKEVVSKHHIYLELWIEDKMTHIRTRLSHNKQDIDDFLISQMAKQTHLEKNEFINFANCTISESQYLEILKRKKQI